MTDITTATGGGLVCLGESLALLTIPTVGRVRHVTTRTLGVAGPESNVAIGVRLLRVLSAWVGKVGSYELGTRIRDAIRGEDVDVSGAAVIPDAPTRLMIKGVVGPRHG